MSEKSAKATRRRKAKTQDRGLSVLASGSLEEKLEGLLQNQIALNRELMALRKLVALPRLQRIARGEYSLGKKEMEKILSDCVGVLQLLRKKGTVTNEELREVFRG